MTYKIGDTIVYRDAGATKTHQITVTQRWHDVIDTYLIPAFEGRDKSGMLRWGHDYQVLVVRSATNGLQ